jgi:hypothetical protein
MRKVDDIDDANERSGGAISLAMIGPLLGCVILAALLTVGAMLLARLI